MKKAITKPLAVLAYLAFLLALFEGAARLCFLIPALSNRLQGDDDATWRRRWIKKHAKGVESHYAFDLFDPTKGWITKPNVRDMKVFKDKFLNTNSRGLRGTQEYPYERQPGKARLLVLGDSLTFGDEVSDNESYPYYLQQQIRDAEIINMGVHGYGHDQMLILLREEGVKYRPDAVILGFIPADMPRNLLRFRDFAKPRFVLDDGGLALTGSPVPRPEDVLKWEWARPRMLDIWSVTKYLIQVRSGSYEKQKAELTTRLLDELVITIRRTGAVPVFVYVPSPVEMNDQRKFAEGDDFLLSYCREKQLAHCFSARPLFLERMRQGVALNTTGHWASAGNRIIAEAISGYLADQHVLPMPEAVGPRD